MSQPTTLVDEASLDSAKVSSRGELIVGALEYSEAYYIRVSVAATETLIVAAKTNRQFVIKDIMITTDKNFASATSGELVTVYEADPHNLATIKKTIFRLELLKNDRLVATGLNLIVSDTTALVAIATDNNVDITISGYYVGN